jgi:HEAT repeat protein
MQLLASSGAPRALDALADVAGKARGQTRVSALELLARARPGDAGVTQLLADSLRSGRRDEAMYAANVLGQLGTEPARQALLGALTGKDADLATVAAAALVEVGIAGPVKTALLSAAQRSPEIKQQLMGQLLQAGEPEGMRMAEELLGSSDSSSASAAVYALTGADTPEARQLIDRALTAKEPSVRIAAMSSFVQNPDDKAADTLARMAKDPDAEVRAMALASLGQVGSDRAQQAIFDAARSATPEDRIAALSALTTLDDERATAQIAQMMRDPDPHVAQAAMRSSSGGGPEADRTLAAIMNDPGSNLDLRRYAASQLRRRGAELDPATAQSVTQLLGAAAGGAGYGRVIITDTDVD